MNKETKQQEPTAQCAIQNVVESYFTVLSFKGQTLQKQIFKGKDKQDVEKQFRKRYPKRGHVDITPM